MGVFVGLGGPGRLCALCCALTALACAAPAAAQLPPVPEVDRAVVEETVKEMVAGQVPAPVEEVLNEPPVAPVREQVDSTVRDVTGVAGTAPGTVATPSPAPPAGGGGAPERNSSGGTPRLGPSRSA